MIINYTTPYSQGEIEQLLAAGLSAADIHDILDPPEHDETVDVSAPKTWTPVRQWLSEEKIAQYATAVWGNHVAPRVVLRGHWRDTCGRSRRWETLPRKSSSWHRNKFAAIYLSKALAGSLECAVEDADMTRMVMVDIDVHPDGDVWDRVDDVVRATGHPLVQWLYCETPSGGLHMWAQLEHEMPTSEAHEWLRGRLFDAGLSVRPGWLEVCPQPGQAYRIPCSTGSDVVDPLTGEVSFKSSRGMRRKAQLDHFLEWTKDAAGLVISACCNFSQHYVRGRETQANQPEPSPKPLSLRSSSNASQWESRVADIVEHGITEPGLRYQETGMLVFELVRQGKDSGQIVEAMMDWARRTKGGASKLAARNYTRFLRTVRDAATRYGRQLIAKRDRGEIGGARPCGAMTEAEIVEVRRTCDELGCEEWLDVLLMIAERYLPLMRDGMPVQIPCEYWRVWAGSDGRRRYKELQRLVGCVLGMAKVGMWKVGRHAQRWVMAGPLAKGGVVRRVAGKVLRIVDGWGRWDATREGREELRDRVDVAGLIEWVMDERRKLKERGWFGRKLGGVAIISETRG